MESSPAIGRRVVVTGLAGSGKSTFALELGARTRLPVIHLDLKFWRPGWVKPTAAEWLETQDAVLAGEEWIADGNYHESLDARLQLADSIVLLDTAWWRCMWRALLRGLHLPDQLPPGCHYSRGRRLRDEWQLAGRTFRNRHREPQREMEIIARHSDRVNVYVLKSKQSIDDFLHAVDVSH